MDPSLRIITVLPLEELWDEHGPVPGRRLRELSHSDLRELLRLGPVRFVVAEVSARPVWVPEKECFGFWKGEVQSHLAEPRRPILLDEFPDGYCYIGVEWEAAGSPIVVLERYH